MIAWDKVFRPKKMGGLGLRKAEVLNKAFLSKLSWKLLTEPDNVWVKNMRIKYPQYDSFFLCKSKSTDSGLWQSLLKNREVFRKGIRWKVGNGNTINFWTDNWCHQQPLQDLLLLSDLSVQEQQLKVSQFISPDQEWLVDELAWYYRTTCSRWY